MKAIQTEYKGYKFRSRLEARWAVFFDSLEIEWVYEPEGYVLNNGKYYLPDFLLPDIRPGVYFNHYESLYIEVKGTSSKSDKPVEFGSSSTPIALLEGEIPYSELEANMRLDGDRYEIFTDVWDGSYLFCECIKCGTIGFEFLGLAERLPCSCPKGNIKYGYNTDRLMYAYKMARQARFEHGETPSF